MNPTHFLLLTPSLSPYHPFKPTLLRLLQHSGSPNINQPLQNTTTPVTHPLLEKDFGEKSSDLVEILYKDSYVASFNKN